MSSPTSLRQYYRAIRKRLPCGRKEKDAILGLLRDAAADFRQTHPCATDDEIILHLGSVQDVTGAYDSFRSAPNNTHDRIVTAAVFVVAAMAVCFVLCLLYLQQTHLGDYCLEQVSTDTHETAWLLLRIFH